MGPTEKAERQVLQIAIPRPPRTQSGTVISRTDGKGKETNAANYNTETTSNPVGSAKYKAKTSPNPQKPTKTTPNPPPNPRSVTHIYKIGGSNPLGFYNTKSRVGGVGWGSGGQLPLLSIIPRLSSRGVLLFRTAPHDLRRVLLFHRLISR